MPRKSLSNPNRWVRGVNDPGKVAVTNEVNGTTYSAAFDTDSYSTVVALLDVTAVSGSPTLDVTLQTSEDASTWVDVASFAQKTGVSNERKRFTGIGAWCRWKRVLAGTGTPKESYSITGYAK